MPKLQRYFVIRVNGANADTHADPKFTRALEMAMPDPSDKVEFGTVRCSDAGKARLKKPKRWTLLSRALVASLVKGG